MSPPLLPARIRVLPRRPRGLPLQGANRITAALSVATMACGCSASFEPGVSVSLLSDVDSFDPDRILSVAPSTEVRVSSASWTNAGVEIGACPTLGARLLELLVPTASAHGLATPTRSAEPVIQSSESAEPVELGTLNPPARAYCTVIYRLAPADGDALGIEAEPDMLGLSVRIRGAFRESGADWQAFELTSGGSLETYRTVLAIDLTEPGTTATIRVRRDIPSWFEGLDLRAPDALPREHALLDNIGRSIRVEAE